MVHASIRSKRAQLKASRQPEPTLRQVSADWFPEHTGGMREENQVENGQIKCKTHPCSQRGGWDLRKIYKCPKEIAPKITWQYDLSKGPVTAAKLRPADHYNIFESIRQSRETIRWEKEVLHRRVYTVRFHLCDVGTQAKLICGKENNTTVLPRMGVGREGEISWWGRGRKKIFWGGR